MRTTRVVLRIALALLAAPLAAEARLHRGTFEDATVDSSKGDFHE